MPMISYAQNREDVLLRRVFPRPVGFYIDVGAADPIYHSVTKWFYECGWSGVNVEPVDEFYQRLVADRPRDVNINMVVADRSGEVPLFEVPTCVGWATVDANTSAKYVADGVGVAPRTAHAITLAELCERFVRGPIDFLKIDVEGGESAVLAGADFTRWRPRVLVIEATEVGRPVQNHQTWEPTVLAADYVYATFDGLNRYYIRAEDQELIPLLAVPPNVFDDYIPLDQYREQQETRHYRERLAATEAELTESHRVLSDRQAETEALRRACAEAQAAQTLTARILDQTRSHLNALQSEALRVAG